jgi:hypothetical protein
VKLAEIQQAIEELPEDQQKELTAWVIRRDSEKALRMFSGDSDLRKLRGAGGIRPDYDYKSLRGKVGEFV